MADVSDWSKWGVSYVKYANCLNDGSEPTAFDDMGTALSGKGMFYAANPWNNSATASANSLLVSTPASLYPDTFYWARQSFYRSIKQGRPATGGWNDLGTLQLGTN